MKHARFTDEQIIGMLKEQESGQRMADVCRKHGISEATFYKYKAKYGGMEVSDARKLKALEDENAKLKKLLAEAMCQSARNVAPLSASNIHPPVGDQRLACPRGPGLQRVASDERATAIANRVLNRGQDNEIVCRTGKRRSQCRLNPAAWLGRTASLRRKLSMAYDKADFQRLKVTLSEILTGDTGEPLSCLLHETPHSHGLLNLKFGDGEDEFLHVAEACNIASIITSIKRILSLPRSNVACEEMAEVLLLRLDVLREFICTAIKRSESVQYAETEADRVIRRWAGFLKHPSDYVFAHSCFSDLEIPFDPPAIEIDCSFLANWDRLSISERDQRKSELAHRLVIVRLPEIRKIESFFKSSGDHLKQLIAANSKDSGTARAQDALRTVHVIIVND